jgi:hypothetical protein
MSQPFITTINKETNTATTVSWSRIFQYRGAVARYGFGFDCDEEGNLVNPNPCAAENFRKCLSGEYDVIDEGVKTHVETRRLCHCGSCEEPEKIYDGKGIYLTSACSKCKAERLKGYRADIFEDYETDEQIDEDY